ncbi:F-box domain protein [Penicillium brasilianum]|uniref:F-box domain protein n=1 Tax=Penicillium brasilianum TaxID=104259 RepID=A0A1S9RY56_PENBI|nr:F-box domain protein [Penicillium brasilianum]
MSRLLNLPSELLARTFSYVDRPSLKSLRQSCRFISQLATDQLFRTVHLQPGETSQRLLQEILNNPSLRRIPRKIYIDTVDESLNYDDEEEQEWPQGWDNLVPQVKKLPRLNAAVLCFDKGFTSDSGDHDWLHYWDFPQTPRFRFHAMHKLFSLLESLRQPIQDLGIRNLQADNPKDPETLAKMSKVLSGLLSLRLSITSETNDAAPEHDLEYAEIRKFFKELPSTWLSPAAPSLQHLSLCSREYSGFYPHLDLSNLFFPRLKTLSLGNFCFFHDTQIDWILKHGDTLEEIYFDDCAVLYDFGMMEQNVDACALPRDTLVRRDGDNISLYGSFEKRWHHIFDLFAEKLPKLRHFRIGHSNWSPDIPFEQEMDIRVGLYFNRYMCCYDGYGPTPYMEGENPKKRTTLENEWRPSPECDDEDRAALRKLLAKLGQSVQESYSDTRFGDRIVDLVQRR